MKHMSTSIIVLIFMALLVAGCSGPGARGLTVTKNPDSIDYRQGESKVEIDKSVLGVLGQPSLNGAEVVVVGIQ